MSEDIEAQTLAEYRRVIEQAAATSPDARAAAAHIFAALDRRDAREREMLDLVRDVAAQNIACEHCYMGITDDVIHTPDCPVTRARALLGGAK